MVKLVRNVTGTILQSYSGEARLFSNISGEVQLEDYVNLYGFVAYLQNFQHVDYVEVLQKPITFGLKNQYNLPTITLEISY